MTNGNLRVNIDAFIRFGKERRRELEILFIKQLTIHRCNVLVYPFSFHFVKSLRLPVSSCQDKEMRL